MKIKLTLRPLTKTYDEYDEEDIDSMLSTEDKLVIYELTEDTDSILLLKIFLIEKLNCSCDSIDLWYKSSKYAQITELKDIDNISSLSFTNSLYETVIYYRSLYYPTTIIIEFYQREMNKIKLKVSISCSIIMLKYIIEHQLINNSYIHRNIQQLYGLSIKTQSNSHKMKINRDNKELENHLKIIDLIKENKDISTGEYIIDDIILNFLLMIDDRARLKMESDDLKLAKVNKKEAEINKEYSNGLNLIYICNNHQCKTENRRFIQRIGYGKCNIIRETINTTCPKCRSTLFVELENVGIVNGKWSLLGGLSIQKPYSFEIEGIIKTLNKVYLIPDLRVSKNYSKLSITVIPIKTISKNSFISKDETLGSFSDNINRILTKTQSFKEMEQFKERANNKCESQQKEQEIDVIHLKNENSNAKLIYINTQDNNKEGSNECCLFKCHHLSCNIF